MHRTIWKVLLVLAFLGTSDVVAQKAQLNRASQDTQPLTRVREGGTPYNPNQSLRPYSVNLANAERSSAGIVASPPEYDPVKGVLYKYATGQWTDIVTAMVAALTGDPSHDEIAYVVVTSTSQRNSATNQFIAAGADMSKVEFLIHPSESIWMRDYGPHFVWLDGTLTIADSHYYPTRPLDNFQPTLIGDDHFGMHTADLGLYYSGGNFQPGPNRSAFVTSLVNLDNPASDGFDENLIREMYDDYKGVDTLHVLPQLPFSVDGTGHIDMWMYMIDEDTVVISEFKPGSNSTAISVTNNAVPYMESLGFEVFRPQAWNSGSTHYTYANAYRVNDRIFIPCYGTQLAPGGNSAYNDEDADALAKWQAAAGPDVEIVPIQCIDIIWASGAIHCIVKQVPRYTAPIPAVHVISPAAGDTQIAGTTETIRWAATDTDNAAIPSVDIFYSSDNGANWTFIANSPNTGTYDWVVPATNSSTSLIQIVANSADSDIGIGTSEAFKTKSGTETVYDFGTGVGISRWVFGTSTTSWNQISGDSTPVTSQISSTNYSRIVTSDATGSDSDTRRYIAPYPGGSGETTHVFEFKISEDRHSIDELVMTWEGYADFCTQAELYVWNIAESDWGDAKGLVGQNRYLDSWAGNADGDLIGTIRSNICDFVDTDGTIKFLIHGQRGGAETFHDYASLVVKQSVGTLDNLEIARGTLVNGELSDLYQSNNTDVSIARDVSQIQAVISAIATTDGKCESPSSISLTLESSVFSRPAVTQNIALFNYDSGQFEVVDSRAASRFSDVTTTVNPTGDLSRFVQPGTGQMQVRLNYVAAIARARFTANIDHVELEVE